MTNRRVQVAGRGVYGRMVPLQPPKRARGVRLPQLGPKGWRFVGLALLVLMVAWGILGFFAVSEVTVAAPHDQQRIEREVRTILGRNFWQANLLLIDTAAMREQLLAADPTIKTADFARQLPHSLRVTVAFKEPGLVWSSGNQLFTLDGDGTAIGVMVGAVTLPLVYDGSNVPVKVGERVAPRRFVVFVRNVIPALAKRGVTVTKLTVGDTTLDLTAETNKGYRLVFDTGREVGEEMVDLDAVWRTMAAQKRSAAEYIDLRIAGKAYYK